MSICTECSEWASKVLETRKLGNGWLRRRRKCECGAVWWTVEIPENNVVENEPEKDDAVD
jgi:transcriptional regulator NrdR family protein